jgi:hypothetical protein
MNQQDLEEAAEIVGAMKDLFREFECRLGEIVSAERIALSGARAEGAKVNTSLHDLALTAARTLVKGQRDLVSRLSGNGSCASMPTRSALGRPRLWRRAVNGQPAVW